METLIIHPKNKEQLAAIKAFVKALKIDFTTKKEKYNEEFVKEVLDSVEEQKSGKPGLEIDVDKMWD
ncbi:hypothetical protein D3C87_108320 [compost metagenome]